METKNLKEIYYRYLTNFLAKDASTATTFDKYMALAYAVRSELMGNWIATQRRYYEQNVRRIYYLSTEYMLGKSLFMNMLGLGIEKELSEAVRSLGFSMEEIFAQEDDSLLGNGSEGRLAACFLEAMATQALPAMAYGLRYDYGQFHQEIRNGSQVERPNAWLNRGHAWEVMRPEYSYKIMLGGECRRVKTEVPLGPYSWKSGDFVYAVPYDIPVVGYRNDTVNTLRLWSARASEEFLPDYLNHGDYDRACEEKSKFSRITQFLFPDEDVRRATDLRMKQQYFFVSASLQDIIRRFKSHNGSILDLDKKVAIHLSGSRCALAIPEMMRILVDAEGVEWNRAWEMTRALFSYTSHAVAKEDSEIWPVYKVGQILPRHLQVIYDINQIHLDGVRTKYGSDPSSIRDLSLIEEGEVKRIKFADMAVLGSFMVNGVSREQTAILKKKVFPSLSAYMPERFTCLVNGIGHRRWLCATNTPLSSLVNKAIGDGWQKKPERLVELEKWAENPNFLRLAQAAKNEAKKKLAASLKESLDITVDESMLFDVQTGKIHPARRQLLHLFHVIHRYLRAKKGEKLPTRRLHIFAGKASPSDFLAKQIIHLISATADLINADEQVRQQMRVVFVPDFSMNWASRITPAAELSEQISTAASEPSGTFNMKFAVNGALTIASQSGTNIEMIEKIGKEYIFSFGSSGEALSLMRDYRPADILAKDDRLKAIVAFIENRIIPQAVEGHAIFPLVASLRDADRHFVLLDFNDYLKVQDEVDRLYGDEQQWLHHGLMTMARIGWFSSDRAIDEYARDIWRVSIA